MTVLHSFQKLIPYIQITDILHVQYFDLHVETRVICCYFEKENREYSHLCEVMARQLSLNVQNISKTVWHAKIRRFYFSFFETTHSTTRKGLGNVQCTL